MPPRLAHTKSRKGCRRCKTRKVKCTEERPACAACTRHDLPCIYPGSEGLKPPKPRASASTTTSVPASPKSFIGPVTPYSIEDDVEGSDHYQRRLLELRLLHHWVTGVVPTLPTCMGEGEEMTTVYTVDIVHMALDFPFLLNTILAFSALHKAQPGQDRVPELIAPNATMPNGDKPVLLDAFEYARAHRIYLNLAIQQQREALNELGPANADAIAMNSALLSNIALKLLPESTGHYEPPVQWLSMAYAVSTIVRAAGPLLTPDTAVQKIMAHGDPDFRDKAVIFNFQHEDPFTAISNHGDPRDFVDDETNLTYNIAIAYVAGIYRAIVNRDPPRQIARRLMTMAPVLPKQFITLVEQRQQKALVVLAHAMCLAKYVENYWFFAGTAEREVYGVHDLLQGDWLWAMRWPLDMLQTLSPPPVGERDE